jgi:hypothetical protein
MGQNKIPIISQVAIPKEYVLQSLVRRGVAVKFVDAVTGVSIFGAPVGSTDPPSLGTCESSTFVGTSDPPSLGTCETSIFGAPVGSSDPPTLGTMSCRWNGDCGVTQGEFHRRGQTKCMVGESV